MSLCKAVCGGQQAKISIKGEFIMAFVNEKLTSEQRAEFVKRKITYDKGLGDVILDPMYWTIDKKRKMCLISAGVSSKDNPEERLFYFELEHSAFFFTLNLNLTKLGANRGIVEWKNLNIKSVSNANFEIDELKRELKSALKVYGLFGNPDPCRTWHHSHSHRTVLGNRARHNSAESSLSHALLLQKHRWNKILLSSYPSPYGLDMHCFY